MTGPDQEWHSAPDQQWHAVDNEGQGDVDDVGEGVSMRAVWIGGAVVGVVLVVAAAVAFGLSGGGEDEPQDTPSRSAGPAAPPPGSTPAAAPSASPTVTGPTPSSSPAPSPSATGPVQRWRGTLAITGPRARRDLDAVPPRLATSGGADVRGDWLKTILKTESDAQVAVVAGRPDAQACRDAAAASGADRTEPLDDGDVVCVVTAQGRVARLTTTHATQTSTSPELRFDAVLWDLPAGS